MDLTKMLFWRNWNQEDTQGIEAPSKLNLEVAKRRQVASSDYYTDSLASLAGQHTIDTKWHAAAPVGALLTKTPAPGSLTVDEAKKIMEDSSPGFKGAPEVANLLASDNLDAKIEQISKLIDQELQNPDRNFEKLQTLIYLIVMSLMHKFKQVDQEFISESGVQIRIQALKVQDSYNTWPAVAITIVGSVIGIAGGAAGLAPLAPISWINAQTAHIFAGASQSIGTAGTGLGGIGSIFNSKGEADRGWRQTYIGEITKKREDKEGSKNNKAQRGNEARSTAHECEKTRFDTVRGIFQS